MKRNSRASLLSYGLPVVAIAAASATAWSGCSVDAAGPEDAPRAVPGQIGVVSEPSEEVCDGLDNDEDGQVDESDPDIGLPCNSGLLGICAPGVYMCKQYGNFACEPNQQPQVEDCNTPEDEDCDGFGGCPGGAHLWSRAFQGAGPQSGNGVTVDGAGNVYATGSFAGTVDFGTGPLTAAGSIDPVVVKLDSSGNTVWVRQFGDTGSGRASTIVVKPSGNVLLVGYFSAFADFGTWTVQSSNDGADFFVVELDPNGNTVWARTFGSQLDDTIISAVVDASGNAYLTGEAYSHIDFGTGLLSGYKDGFLVKLDPTGNTLWAKRFVGNSESQVLSSLVTPSGDVLLVARAWSGSIDFGNGPIVTTGDYDSYIARFDPAGNVQDVHAYGGPGIQGFSSIARDSSGNLIIAGFFDPTINLGAGPLIGMGNFDGFVAKLDPSYNVVWQKRLGGPDIQYADAIVDAADNVIVVGTFSGSIDFGAGTINAAAGDAYAVKYDPAGNLLWNKTFGDAAYQNAVVATTDASGNIFFTGGFMGSIGFGGATFTSVDPAGYDAYLVKLGP